MAKVAHSAIIIQKAFRIYKRKKLEGRLRKGVVKVNETKVSMFYIHFTFFIFKVRKSSNSQSSFAQVVQSAVTIQRAYRIYKNRKSAGLVKQRKPSVKTSITKQAKVFLRYLM